VPKRNAGAAEAETHPWQKIHMQQNGAAETQWQRQRQTHPENGRGKRSATQCRELHEHPPDLWQVTAGIQVDLRQNLEAGRQAGRHNPAGGAGRQQKRTMRQARGGNARGNAISATCAQEVAITARARSSRAAGVEAAEVDPQQLTAPNPVRGKTTAGGAGGRQVNGKRAGRCGILR